MHGYVFCLCRPDKGACPRGGGHEAAGFNFVLRHDTPEPGQQDWRFCHKCTGMFFDGRPDKGCLSEGWRPRRRRLQLSPRSFLIGETTTLVIVGIVWGVWSVTRACNCVGCPIWLADS